MVNMTTHDPLKRAYSYQKKRARDRGIPWLFSFVEWKTVWETQLGPEWFALRGKHRNQYVMARFNDIGPYAPWNVECITTTSNHKQKTGRVVMHYGVSRRVGKKLTPETVLAIFSSKSSLRTLSREHGICVKTVQQIKKREIWKHVLNGMEGATTSL